MYNLSSISCEEYLRLNHATKYDDPVIFNALMPSGWKVLNSSADTDDYLGYFGRAYIKGSQIIISNRGSIDLGDYKQYPDSLNYHYNFIADYLVNNVHGVYMFRGPLQISSAESFYLYMNQTYGTQYDISLTGFSLGELLSVILSNKYSLNAIVFDTPGEIEIMQNLKIEISDKANITAILSKPNIVNTHGTHSSNLYHLAVEHIHDDDTSLRKFVLDTPTVHNIDFMLKAIPTGLKNVQSWPNVEEAYNNFILTNNVALQNQWKKLKHFTKIEVPEFLYLKDSTAFCKHWGEIKNNLTDFSHGFKENYYAASEYCDEFAEFLDKVTITNVYTHAVKEQLERVKVTINDYWDLFADKFNDMIKPLILLIGDSNNQE